MSQHLIIIRLLCNFRYKLNISDNKFRVNYNYRTGKKSLKRTVFQQNSIILREGSSPEIRQWNYIFNPLSCTET